MSTEDNDTPFLRFRTSDGTSISYRTWGKPAGRPVVLQHGFASDTREDWVSTGIVRALADSDFSVIGVDARGHGASDAPHDSDAYGVVRSTADLIELTDALGHREFNLVGYSMGAVIAAEVALRKPRSVRRLVLGGIGSSLVELGGVDSRVVPFAVLAETFRTDEPDSILDPGLALWRAAVDAAGWDSAALALIADSLGSSAVEAGGIIAPTLILVGDEDPFAGNPGTVVDALPDGRLIIVPGDHTSARYSPLFSSSIITFLTEH